MQLVVVVYTLNFFMYIAILFFHFLSGLCLIRGIVLFLFLFLFVFNNVYHGHVEEQFCIEHVFIVLK